jgi:putative ABC transport system permease protein
MAAQKVKEISIRKVLGASVSDIVTLLSKDFLQLAVIAFMLASPVAWFAMSTWLANFEYRIQLGPGLFVLAGVIALVIALLTICSQAIKAALTNPVKSLKSE